MRVSGGFLVLTLLGCGPVSAQEGRDAAAVCVMAERHYMAIRAGDGETVLRQHMPEFTFFRANGGLLSAFRSVDQQRTEILEGEPPPSFSAYIRHCSAQVYGTTGIATYYLVGSVTSGETTWRGTWRVTEVWVRQGNEWKEAHHHESALLDSVTP